MNPSLGQIAYEAYSELLTMNGAGQFCKFSELSLHEQQGWEAAAEAVTAALISGEKMPAGKVE